MTVYLDLADFLLIAERVLGVDAKTLGRGTGIGLADSALNAPAASFGGVPSEGSCSPASRRAIAGWLMRSWCARALWERQ